MNWYAMWSRLAPGLPWTNQGWLFGVGAEYSVGQIDCTRLRALIFPRPPGGFLWCSTGKYESMARLEPRQERRLLGPRWHVAWLLGGILGNADGYEFAGYLWTDALGAGAIDAAAGASSGLVIV
jgi:hypothetical protein